MGKSDKRRAQNKIDEQQKLSQGYLTGVQSQLAGQYGNYGNAMFGGAPSPVQNTFGWGTTTPQFSWSGSSYFPGSTTGNATPYGQQAQARTGPPGGLPGERRNPNAPAYPPAGANTGGGGGGGFGGGPANYQIAGGQPVKYDTPQVQGSLMPILNKFPATPQGLQQALPEIQKAFPGTYQEDSDEIVIPGYGRIDVGGGFETGKNQRWTFQSQLENLKKGKGPAGPVGQGAGGGILGQTMADYGNIMKYFQNWADTGGLTEQDKANLRQRAVSPARGIYARGEEQLERQRSLQGGYSPGATTALGRFNREMGQQTSDIIGNAEAAITDMMLRGKQFGAGGMSNMYGQTPGLAQTVGNQMLASMGQQLQASGLQNQLGSSLTGNQIEQGNMQGFPWAQTLQTIGALAGGLGGLPGIAGMFSQQAPLANYGPQKYGAVGPYSGPRM